MRKVIWSLLGILSTGFMALPAAAQQVDNTAVLPDAKPGECYAKVITPAKFTTRSEELVIQEASERIETIDATYKFEDQTIVVKDASQAITATDSVYSKESEKVEVRAAEMYWTTKINRRTIPASPDALDHIKRSGIDADAVDIGGCFVEYFTEAQYKSEAHRVLKKEATQRIEIMAAEYESIDERVVIKEASSEVVDVPAIYRTETESVLVEPARSVWKENCGVIERVDNATGDVMCLVEVPARYETLTKTVLDTPATTKTISVPAVYKTVKVERLVNPASEKHIDVPAEYETINKRVRVSEPVFFWLAKGEAADANAVATGREICRTERPAEYVNVSRQVVAEAAVANITEVPARYETFKTQRLVSPASERRIVIPARTKTVTSQVETSSATVEWRKVLCEVNLNRKLVTSLQRALKREGYEPGPIDGMVGQTTLVAIKQYQIKEGIDRGGITYETLKHLKVQP